HQRENEGGVGAGDADGELAAGGLQHQEKQEFRRAIYHLRLTGSSAYAIPVRLPSAACSIFLSDPSRFALYTEPPRSVRNIRPPLISSERPIASIRWVKTISGSLRLPG